MAAEASLRDRRSRLLAEPGLRVRNSAGATRPRPTPGSRTWPNGRRATTSGTWPWSPWAATGASSLCPYSDLDVVLVHDGPRDIAKVADGIWYPVWDEGVHLDHSVRRPSEVLSAAAEDVRVALGLLDGRLVWGEAKVAEPLLEKARAAWRDRLGTKYLPLLERADGRAAHDGGRRRLPARARPQGEPWRPARRHRAARHLRLRAAAGRVRRPGLARRARRRCSPTSGSSSTASPGASTTSSCSRTRTTWPALGFTDADALMLAVSTAGPPDRLGQRRRVAPAAALGPHPTAEAPLPPRRARRTPAAGAGDLGPDMVEVDGEIALTPLAPVSDDTSLPLRLAATAAGLDRPDRQGLPAPPGRPHAAAGRPVDGRDPRGARGPARPGPTRRRQDRVARPARPAGAAHSRVVRRPQQAPAQRLPHLHRRPAPPGGRRARRRVDRHGRAAGPAPRRHAPPRHRQGFPRRPHRRRHGGRRAHHHAHGVRRPPTSTCWSTSCATISCSPTPRRGGTSTTRPRSPASPAPPATASPCTSWPP